MNFWEKIDEDGIVLLLIEDIYVLLGRKKVLKRIEGKNELLSKIKKKGKSF